MNVYITMGTFEYLKGIELKHPSESMVMMVNEDSALLLHETSKTSVFKEPRKYEVVGSSGLIGKEGFAVMNNIPVAKESSPLFEHHFKDLPSLLKKEMGLIAIRVLRPLSSNTYIILTIWESALTYEDRKTLFDSELKKGYEKVNHSNIFTSAPYVSKFSIPAE
jgi:heme oxygenase (mycobilin-producing)